MKRLISCVFFIGLYFGSEARPVASFSPSTVEGCSPLIINFTNNSGNAVKYLWDFGNGNTSTKTNPSAIYYIPGYYSVRLIATDANGISDTIQMNNIRVFRNPLADFKADRSSICANDEILYTNLSIEGDTSIRFFTYDFGNGIIGTKAIESTRYTKPGNYSVGLHVVDLNGCESDTVFSNYIKVKSNPVAGFTVTDSQYCSTPAEVKFTNQSSIAEPHNYVWYFGDGKTSTSKDPIHQYQEFGSYNVRLICFGNNGCKDTIDKESGIKVEPLKADFEVTSSTCGPADIDFINLTNSNLPGTTYIWDFGNGVKRTTKDVKIRLDPGDYKIKLSVYAGTCFNEVTRNFTVYAKPKGKITFDPPVICQTPQDFKAVFTGSYPNDLYSYEWKDGPKVISNQKELNYNYTGKSTHFIILKVTNGTCSVKFWDSLKAEPPSVMIIPDQDTGGCAEFEMKFRSLAQSISPVVAYSWDFGDGGSSDAAEPVHVYKEVGKFTVRLTIVTAYGCKASDTTDVYIGKRIEPKFTFDTSAVCNGELIHFINQTVDTPYAPSSYAWNFINVKTGESTGLPDYSEREFDHKSKFKPGDYKVTLTTIHHKYCYDTFTYPFTIHVKAPLASPSVFYDSCGPTDVKFTDNSVGATSIKWLSPGMINGLSDKVLVRFLQPGNYTATLTAYNKETGCRDTTSVPFSLIGAPDVDMELIGDLDCPPVTLRVKAKFKYTGNFVLTINGVSERFYGMPVIPWSIDVTYDSLPSVFDVIYYADNLESCTVRDTQHLAGKGPVADGIVKAEGKCLPLPLELTDLNFGNDDYDHYWLIDNKIRIDIKERTMTTSLSSLPSGKDSLSVKLFVGRDQCMDIKEFIVPVNGINVLIERTITQTMCEDIVYYMKAQHDYKKDTLEYKWGHNGTWYKGFGPEPTYATIQKMDGGSDTIMLRVRSNKGCEMEVHKIITSPEPSFVADFTADVTGSICPPLKVNFTDRSRSNKKIVSWDWNFGEDARSGKQNPQRVYLLPGTYPVTLTVINADGCTTTVTHPDFITIDGPKVEANIAPKVGCVPLKVSFSAKSEEEVSFKWDLGDGTLRSDGTFEYTYLEAGRFIPLVTVSDSFGCTYTLPPADTIFVADYPEADIMFEGFCAGQNVRLWPVGLEDTAVLTGMYWSLGDGTRDTGFAIDHVFAKAGMYRVTFTTENLAGCRSTATLDLSITGAEPRYNVSNLVICYNEAVRVRYDGTTSNGTEITSWKLDGVDLGHTNSSFDLSFGEKGVHSLSVEIVTDDGCVFLFEDEQAFSVADNQPLGTAELRRVSVVDDDRIELKVKEENKAFVESYKAWIVKDGNMFEDLDNWDAGNSTHVASGFNTLRESYCLIATRENHCATNSTPDSSAVHCTIELKAHGDSLVNKLNWSPYVGWGVRKYDILSKMEAAGEWEFLSSVPGDQLDYTDSIITCEAKRRYKILAHESGGHNEFSFSDSAHAVPLYNHVVPAPEIWRVSVEDDQMVLIEWVQQGKNIHPVSGFELVRYDEGRRSVLGQHGHALRDSVDHAVHVHDRSYIYQVRAQDTCKNWSPFTNIGKTVLLRATYDAKITRPVLIWSRYMEWNEGVDHYLVEKKTLEGSFQVIGRSIGPDDTTFTDETAIQQCSPDFCYRITAIRNQPVNFPDSTHDVISHSNEDCAMVQSHLYAPNAFTMNRDGLNETFQPVGLFISEYNLKIFNRWGELLFETSDCMEGWDGTYKNEPCMMGVYLYIVNAKGADNKAHNLHGTVHLLK